MFKRVFLGTVLSGLLLIISPGVSTAAPLGLSTGAPNLGASFTFIDYFEFFTDGDLSSFGALVDNTNDVSPVGLAEISFGIGFDLLDPSIGASGGFDVFDNNGLFLAGDLFAVGYQEDVIELQFNNLSGSSAASFNASVLLEVLFDDPLGTNPFASLTDGFFYTGQLNLLNIVDSTTNGETPMPVPGTFFLVLLSMGLLLRLRPRLVHSEICSTR